MHIYSRRKMTKTVCNNSSNLEVFDFKDEDANNAIHKYTFLANAIRMVSMEKPQVCRDIPSHVVLFHILPRLPITSLQRFRSVSKQWYSFLKTRVFANIHTHRVTIGDHQLKSKLLVLSTTKYAGFFSSTQPPEFKFRIIDCEALEDASGDSRPLPFIANLKDIKIMSSLHGLVCVGIGYYDDLVLWNPLTGEYKNDIQKNYNMKSDRIALGLYYSTCDDDYKLLTVLIDNSVYIYSLKSESWRIVDSTHNYQTLSKLERSARWGMSNWVNGDLYFLYDDKIESSIIKFDTKVERFTVIPTPPSLKGLDVKHLSMTVKKGVIHLGVKYETSSFCNWTNAFIQVWRMIRDENWEKVGGPFGNWEQYRANKSMDPLYWIRNKTWLMIKDKEYLCKIDLDTNRESFCTKIGTSSRTGRYTETFMFVDYAETFMLVDRSI